MKKALTLFLWSLAILIAFAIWGMDQIRSYANAPINISTNKLINVEEGANYASFTSQLVAEGIIDDSFWAKFAGRIYPQFSKLKAGTYQIYPNISLIELFELTITGKEHQFSITFVEGTTFKEWRAQLQNTANIKHSIQTLSEPDIAKALGLKRPKLEGLLLPETYYYSAGESDLVILKRAADSLTKVINEAWDNRDKSIPVKSQYDLLKLASIIEKETGLVDERRRVASVFMNRLKINMRLQTDPTVIYGMGDSYDGNISKKDLQTPTAYNTYVIYGLPPTPIAMSGKAAIFAAANPEKTPYFYFVAKGNGGHQFSKTLAEHNAAVASYLEYLKNN